MPLKKPTSILPSYPNAPVSGAGSPIFRITSSCSVTSQRPARPRLGQYMGSLRWDAERTPGSKCNHYYARCYASVSSPSPKQPSSAATEHTWPTSLHPTPYEVLAHSRDARYNKALFYELVKIYHPDRNLTTVGSSIPHSVRLERYRLVVAANEILSDDAKRRAYDLYGAGWNGNRTLQSLYREADRSWRNEPGNPSRNATWEDWEKWRRERDGQGPPQTSVFMSNELFVTVLCFFVVLGSFAQARRASTSTLNVVDMHDQKHAAISDNMRRRHDQQASLSRDERIQSFLRQRDRWNLVSSKDSSAESPP